MAKNRQISVLKEAVSVQQIRDDDYISITDIARHKNREATGLVISHWLSTRYTLEFMGLWESLYNPDFNVTEFRNIRNEAGSNGFVLSCKQWISATNAKGIVSKAGRYGGTYAHRDIAFEFASWISAEFKLYLIKEFQRLKEDEQKQMGWDIRRNLARINYRIHTDAVQAHLIPPELTPKQVCFVYANEADVLNMALFGMTAKQWREANPGEKGNIRDLANAAQLVSLANLESLNALLIKEEVEQPDRLRKLNSVAIEQMRVLADDRGIKRLKGGN